jgi:hypothetical protein
MRLYGAINKVEPQSDGTVKVEGIASTEAVDDQGEVVRADAMRAAIPDYMRFPALREMHQLSAAGTTLEAEVGDDGCTRIVAHVVDPVAVSKVKTLTYRGFSIGGQVTERDTANRKIITGITLNEISLVDRPANPEAILDCWKASTFPQYDNQSAFDPKAVGHERQGMTPPPEGWAAFDAAKQLKGTKDMEPLATLGETPAGEKLAALAAMLEPVQVWACGVADHQHAAKGDAVKCLEKRASGVRTAPDGDPELAGSPDEAEMAAAAAKAYSTESAAEGATAQEPPGDADPPTDGEKRAAASPGEAQTALEAAREAMDRANALLAGPEAAAKAKDDKPEGDYGDVSYADEGLQADGKKRYPIDTEEHIRAAWSYINKPKNCAKYEGGDCAKVKAKIVAAWKDKIDQDGPPSASGKAASISEFGDFLDALIDEQVSLSAIITSLHKTITDPEQLEALVSSVFEKGARHGATDQVHLDNAEYCCAKAMATKSASKTEKMDIADAHKAVLDAGATSLSAPASHSAPHNATQDTGKAVLDSGATSIAAPPSSPPPRNATQDTGRNAETQAPQTSAGKVPESPMPKASDQELLEDAINKVGASIATLSKAGEQPGEIIEILASAETMKKAGAPPHHILMDMAHRSLKAFSNGSTCKADAPDPERHTDMDMTRVHKAHYHLGRVGGGQCDTDEDVAGRMPSFKGTGEGASSSAKAITGDDLAKALADKTSENALLTKTLSEIVPLMASMHARIEENALLTKRIADTPMPPRAIARTAGASLTKAADNGLVDQAPDLVSALAQMTPEEQTLTMIKATQRNPILVRSLATPAQQRENFPAR